MDRLKVALCLPGGGITGAMYQIGALAALEHSIDGLEASGFDLYIAASSGATVAAALAGGLPVQRLYRALLDPADTYFPLERSHLTRMDLDEWRRTLVTALGALVNAGRSLTDRTTAPKELWEQLDRFYDSLPAGLFSLHAFERLLEEFFLRRGVPNSFPALPHALRIIAHDLDTGERVLFGSPGFDDVPVARACCASTALPLFYSPVRIHDRHYIDGGVGGVSHIDIAAAEGADLIIIVNPLVPVRPEAAAGVPTGHGTRGSIRDKGLMWVYNQAMRIGAHARMDDAVHRFTGGAAVLIGQSIERIAPGDASPGNALGSNIRLLLLEPDPADAVLFLHSPASFAARREILEYAYRTTRERIVRWLGANGDAFAKAGWRLAHSIER